MNTEFFSNLAGNYESQLRQQQELCSRLRAQIDAMSKLQVSQVEKIIDLERQLAAQPKAGPENEHVMPLTDLPRWQPSIFLPDLTRHRECDHDRVVEMERMLNEYQQVINSDGSLTTHAEYMDILRNMPLRIVELERQLILLEIANKSFLGAEHAACVMECELKKRNDETRAQLATKTKECEKAEKQYALQSHLPLLVNEVCKQRDAACFSYDNLHAANVQLQKQAAIADEYVTAWVKRFDGLVDELRVASACGERGGWMMLCNISDREIAKRKVRL